jgi:hypothetical protein
MMTSMGDVEQFRVKLVRERVMGREVLLMMVSNT